MAHILRVQDEAEMVHTKKGESLLAWRDRPCKVFVWAKAEWIYFQLTEETNTTFGGYRLQQDSYTPNKFYVTDEKNKWHGVLSDGPLTKGRKLYVMKVE